MLFIEYRVFPQSDSRLSAPYRSLPPALVEDDGVIDNILLQVQLEKRSNREGKKSQKNQFEETFLSFLETGELSDVTLVLIESDGGEEVGRIAAHRIVLAASSEYFHSMFTSSWSEARGGEVTIALDQFHPKATTTTPTTTTSDSDSSSNFSIAAADIFKAVLRFMYGEGVKADQDNVLFYLHAAERFAIKSLKKKCMRWLRTETVADNVFHLCQNATAMGLLDAQGI